MNNETVSLYFKEGPSDKVYHAQLTESTPVGWSVDVQYGRRGSTLTSLNKCLRCPYDKAKKTYDNLIKEKKAKGYQPGENGTGYTAPKDVSERKTAFVPQLLNEIEEKHAEEFISQDAFLAQEKEDGKRIGIIKQGHTVTAANRKGLTVGIPEMVQKAIAECGGNDFVLDGEMCGDTYKVFDLLEYNEDIRHQAYRFRLTALNTVVEIINSPYVRLTITEFTKAGKSSLYHDLRDNGREGIVFKRKDAPYIPGRPASKGTQYKLKFWATCSVIVSKINDKRSVAVHLYDPEGADIPVGNVSVPVNHELPKVNDIIEARYLYAYKGGSLFQPQYQGVREDLEFKDCRISQLKYKNEDE